MGKKATFPQIDLNRVRTIELKQRRSKVDTSLMGKPLNATGARTFFNSLPDFLKASDLIEYIASVVKARKKGLPFHIMMGAHVIKVGLSPIVIDLIIRDILTGVSFNSAGLIHDLELSFAGKTSEDVEAGLHDGSFGMSEITGLMFADVSVLAENNKIGLGEAAGKYITEKKAPYKKYSIFAAAYRKGIPATIHAGIGTDIVAQMPTFNAGAVAEASYRDFKILSRILSDADRGGVVANIGSAVLLPEVFLKALTVARNIKKQPRRIVTANFDMINHYRPTQNVVRRPTSKGGKGFSFTGHHEIMIPLLAWGLKAYTEKK